MIPLQGFSATCSFHILEMSELLHWQGDLLFLGTFSQGIILANFTELSNLLPETFFVLPPSYHIRPSPPFKLEEE